MQQETREQDEIQSWNEIKEILRETSIMMRETEANRQAEDMRRKVEYDKRQAEYDKRQAEYEKRQAEYTEYERRSREADEQRKAEYAEYERRSREADEQRKAEHAEYERKSREAEERRQAEFERSQAEYEKRVAEDHRQMEELRQQMKDTKQYLREMGNKYTSQIGHVVEGLMEPSAMALFQQVGFDICKCWKNMKCKRKDLNMGMEVDLFLHDTTDAVAVEVKTNCCKSDVDYFLKQMEKFGTLFPEYAGVNVYLAMAAINYDHESDKYAAEKGLFVIRVCEDVFSLDPAKKESMTYFYQGERYRIGAKN